MSWYKDPELFISCWGSDRCYYIDKIVKKFNVPLQNGDISFVEHLNFSKHLYLGNNKESDYDAFKSSLPVKKYVNCQGLVVHWDIPKQVGTWSRVEEHDSIFYSLPGVVINPFVTVLAEKLQAVEKQNSELVAEISGLKDKLNKEVTYLQEQLHQEKSDRQAQVSDLTSKLKECRGSCGAEPWMSGCSVPSNWVPFGELDVVNIPRDTPLMITEAPGAPQFGEDTSTNVQANKFCQGIFPVVLVNVADLIPNNGKARFDPDIWCSINNAGNYYAARKSSG